MEAPTDARLDEMIAQGERFVGMKYSDSFLNSADRLEALELLAALRELRARRSKDACTNLPRCQLGDGMHAQACPRAGYDDAAHKDGK